MDIKVLIPLAQGTEETEAVTIIDLLRRAGIQVKVAGENEIITCSHGIKIIPDLLLQSVDEDLHFNAIIIPGGSQGVQNLIKNEYLQNIFDKYRNTNILFAAICAGPLVLSHFRILKKDSYITSHPIVKEQLSHYQYEMESVVCDGNIITSRGAGTAVEFTLSIINYLAGSEIALKISKEIVYNHSF